MKNQTFKCIGTNIRFSKVKEFIKRKYKEEFFLADLFYYMDLDWFRSFLSDSVGCDAHHYVKTVVAKL